MGKSRREFLHTAVRATLLAAFATSTTKRALADTPAAKVPQPSPLSKNTMPAPQNAQSAADVDLARRIKAISNIFEVGRPEPDYAYVEDLGDGRGYTVTQYGFCTYNDEVAQVINRYVQHVPDTHLKKFLPHLPPASDGTSTKALAGFPAAWRKEIKASPFLGIACDDEADMLYLRPALAAAASADVTTAIGKAIFYDTWLQHGASTDADSLPTILERTIEETGGVEASSEADFLRAFLAIRKSVLHAPHNHETKDVWRESAGRVDALRRLLDNNPDLAPPIEVANADIDVVVL
jgi:chitosanase